jgi:hypothetical protein
MHQKPQPDDARRAQKIGVLRATMRVRGDRDGACTIASTIQQIFNDWHRHGWDEQQHYVQTYAVDASFLLWKLIREYESRVYIQYGSSYSVHAHCIVMLVYMTRPSSSSQLMSANREELVNYIDEIGSIPEFVGFLTTYKIATQTTLTLRRILSIVSDDDMNAYVRNLRVIFDEYTSARLNQV